MALIGAIGAAGSVVAQRAQVVDPYPLPVQLSPVPHCSTTPPQAPQSTGFYAGSAAAPASFTSGGAIPNLIVPESLARSQPHGQPSPSPHGNHDGPHRSARTTTPNLSSSLPRNAPSIRKKACVAFRRSAKLRDQQQRVHADAALAASAYSDNATGTLTAAEATAAVASTSPPPFRVITLDDDAHTLPSLSALPFVRWKTSGSWFRLPAEMRTQIYQELLRLPACHELYDTYYSKLGKCHWRRGRHHDGAVDGHQQHQQQGEPSPEPQGHRLHTPSILLVSRAVTAECLPILGQRTLLVDRLPPWIPGRPAPMLVSQFVGRATLQKLRHIDLRVDFGRGDNGSGWIWQRIVEDLLDILAEANAFATLRIVVKLFQINNVHLWQHESLRYKQLMDKIDWFREVNPEIWTPGLVEVEEWEVSSDGVFLLKPKFVRDRKICNYPNTDMIPASITEFLLADRPTRAEEDCHFDDID